MTLLGRLRSRQAQVTYLSLLLFGLLAITSSHDAEGIPWFEKFRKFELIYEPSGVQQLPDGRFVVVEDEAVHPLDVFSLQPDGRVFEQPVCRGIIEPVVFVSIGGTAPDMNFVLSMPYTF